MTNDQQIPPKSGLFSIDEEDNIRGTVSFQESCIILSFWSNRFSSSSFSDKQDIIGILDNGKKISLLKCIRRGFKIGDTRTSYEFLAHYVVIGSHHILSSKEEIISEVSFTIDDSYALFGDQKSFGTFRLDLDQLRQLNCLGNFGELKFVEGNCPIIAYWTGKSEIFSADTVIGKISAHNNVSLPEKTYIKNKVSISVRFVNSVSVEEMYEKTDGVLQFFGIIAGRPQNLLETTIITETSQAEQLSIHSHKNIFSIFTAYPEHPDPTPCSILINPANDPDGFENLMSKWLKRNETWRYARSRFFDAWGKQRSYDPDRIIAAANMFDLLPSPEGTLRRKILYRLQIVLKTIKEHLEKDNSSRCSENVIDDLKEIDCSIVHAAVELRNFYVHGDKADGSRKKLIEFRCFLTDTLEFIFCVSDLIESGWDFLSWHKKAKPELHPFAKYLYHYRNNFNEIKFLLHCPQPNHGHFSCPLNVEMD